MHAGISIQVLAHQLHIAERRGHQDVRLASTRHQVPRHILPVVRIVPLLIDTQHVLRRRRLVIHIARIDRPRHAPEETPRSPPWRRSAAASAHPRRAHAPRSGSAATSSRSLSIIPSRAAACASITAPRSTRKSTMAGSQSSSTPNPPAHHSVRLLMSAPASSSTSIVARSLRCTAANSACAPEPYFSSGPLIFARNSAMPLQQRTHPLRIAVAHRRCQRLRRSHRRRSTCDFNSAHVANPYSFASACCASASLPCRMRAQQFLGLFLEMFEIGFFR